MATVTAVQSGLWTDPDTWDEDVPASADDAVIPADIVVEVDSNITRTGDTSVDAGTLVITSAGKISQTAGTFRVINYGALLAAGQLQFSNSVMLVGDEGEGPGYVEFHAPVVFGNGSDEPILLLNSGEVVIASGLIFNASAGLLIAPAGKLRLLRSDNLCINPGAGMLVRGRLVGAGRLYLLGSLEIDGGLVAMSGEIRITAADMVYDRPMLGLSNQPLYGRVDVMPSWYQPLAAHTEHLEAR